MDVNIDQINAAIQSAMAKDPRLKQLLEAARAAAVSGNIDKTKQAQEAYYAALRQNGIPIPEGGLNQGNAEAFIDFGTGLARSDPKAMENWKAALIGLGAVGGFGLAAPAIAGAWTGGAAPAATAGAGTGTTGSTVPVTGGLAGGAAGTPGLTNEVLKGLGKTSGSSALGWLSLAGQVATPLVGGFLANSANEDATRIATEGQLEAARIQAQSNKDALDFAKQGYITQQEQLAPYVGTGGAAMTKLSQLTGLGTPKPYVVPESLRKLGTPDTSTPTASAPTATPAPQNGQMVTLKAPTGEVTQKPLSEAQHWVSLGAQIVPGA